MKKVLLFKLVEWVDMVGDKLGCFFFNKKNKVLLLRKNLVFNLVNYGVDSEDVEGDVRIGWDVLDNENRLLDFFGLDMFFLFVFLLNFLFFDKSEKSNGEEKILGFGFRFGLWFGE